MGAADGGGEEEVGCLQEVEEGGLRGNELLDMRWERVSLWGQGIGARGIGWGS